MAGALRSIFIVALAVVLGSCAPPLRRHLREASVSGHSSGPAGAPVVIVQFGDYGCGPCAALGRRLRGILEERRSVRLVYHHCPARRHEAGREASLIALAAAEQGRFWEVHWLLVERGPVGEEGAARAAAEEVGIDPTLLDAAMSEGRHEAALDRELALADQLRIRGTPTTFVGGRRLEGTVSRRALLEAIDAALAAPR